MRAPVPATASTKRAVRVATPERWPRKLSAVRSAASSAARRPARQRHLGRHLRRATAPRPRACRRARPRTGASSPRPASSPKATPGCFCTIRARARASAGTVAAVVTSPCPTSSARARRTISSAARQVSHRASLDQRRALHFSPQRRARRLCQGASAVALQGEDVLAGPEDRLDPLADRGEVKAVVGLVLSGRPDDRGLEVADRFGEARARRSPCRRSRPPRRPGWHAPAARSRPRARRAWERRG